MPVFQTMKESTVKVKTKPTPKTTPSNGDELEESLVSAIDASLEASNGMIWKQSKSFAPSNTNQCPRFMAYRLQGYQQKVSFPGRIKRLFELGNIIEDKVESLFDGLGILLDSQIEVRIEDPPIFGYCDFLIDWDGPKPVECKSINEAGYAWRRHMHKPKDEHYRQLQFYLHAMDMEQGFVLYYSKNDSGILPLLVNRDREFIDKLLKKYAIIYKAYKDGKLPKRPYKETSDKCKYCDAKEHCWSDPEEGIKL
jgi:CRISPR/Cas system-associated exonuclease Cas4 (RecB family)